jgi:hypothetical protein
MEAASIIANYRTPEILALSRQVLNKWPQALQFHSKAPPW